MIGAFLSSTPPPRFHYLLEQIMLQMASSLDLQLALATIQQDLSMNSMAHSHASGSQQDAEQLCGHAGISLACMSSQDYS
jgi:hypothetical protein